MSKIEIFMRYCDGSEYVLFPACAYNGNRFNVIKKEYPPMFLPEEATVDMPVTITDVVRLEKDGSGKIEVTTGDVSVPCVAVFSQTAKKATFVYTIQEIGGKNIGLAYEREKITLSYPAYRENIYHWPHMYRNTQEYCDMTVDIPHKIFEIDCESMEQFYHFFFEHRKCMGMDDMLPKVLSFEMQFEIQRNKFNSMNWCEDKKFYDIDSCGSWQPGWCGGAMSTYPLMKLGGLLEKERALKTLEFLFVNQAPSGLFHAFDDRRGDGFGTKGTKKWLLIRKSADCLYFMFKHFELMDSVPVHFIEGTRRLADAFVKIWKENGQFGQFIDCDTGEVVVGGSTSGAIIPAGMAIASRYFNNQEYLEVAKAGAEMMYHRDALKGYTTGGPGEILQCPDSESAFGLLESMVALFEVTAEAKWLHYAEFMAHMCSSWVVSYNYKFPEYSEFSRLNMKTIGSVFANAQNKHSAPGICTLSGNSLFKLYKWTGNELYNQLYDDIALTISQYMSTNERPIYSWGVPKDATAHGETNEVVAQERLPEGFICERVNMSDWETERCIGGVFNGSCWCETSNLLTIAEYKQA